MVGHSTIHKVEKIYPEYQTIYYKCKICPNYTTDSESALHMHIQDHSVIVVVTTDGKLKEVEFNE